MNAEQQRAHNLLTLPLWLEWEKFCVAYADGDRACAVDEWIDCAYEWFRGQAGSWGWRDGAFDQSDFEVGDDYYTWIGAAEE